jgi:hypothetical protein
VKGNTSLTHSAFFTFAKILWNAFFPNTKFFYEITLICHLELVSHTGKGTNTLVLRWWDVVWRGEDIFGVKIWRYGYYFHWISLSQSCNFLLLSFLFWLRNKILSYILHFIFQGSREETHRWYQINNKAPPSIWLHRYNERNYK